MCGFCDVCVCFLMCAVCMCEFCDVWVRLLKCVGVSRCGFCNVYVCVCVCVGVGFVMCGCVYMWVL